MCVHSHTVCTSWSLGSDITLECIFFLDTAVNFIVPIKVKIQLLKILFNKAINGIWKVYTNSYALNILV